MKHKKTKEKHVESYHLSFFFTLLPSTLCISIAGQLCLELVVKRKATVFSQSEYAAALKT